MKISQELKKIFFFFFLILKMHDSFNNILIAATAAISVQAIWHKGQEIRKELKLESCNYLDSVRK